jgi:hypothetical protein
MVENKGFSRKLFFETSLFLLDHRRSSYYRFIVFPALV